MVKIVQLLCPERHTIIAAAYEEGKGGTFEEVRQRMKDQIAALHINPWCGICGSRELHYEEGTTSFKTMAEAEKPLQAVQVLNMASREIMDRAGLTFERARQN